MIKMGSNFYGWIRRACKGFGHSSVRVSTAAFSSVTSGRVIDLRSDCLSQPTSSMKQAMLEASTGDDVFKEDSCVLELQNHMAALFGKEAALFVPSGTMGNLLSIMSQTSHARGLEVIVGDMSHLTMYEQGGLAMIAHVHPRAIRNNVDGTFALDTLSDYIRPHDDIHQPWTAMIAVENTHNNCGGKVLPISFLRELKDQADYHGLKIHLDGARLMNAVAALDIPPREILQYVDTVTMCFSKGVGSPVGSIIAGDSQNIERCVRLRKALGGGWRKPGFLAKAALHAMEDVVERMKQDHANAKRIASAVMERHHNIVYIDVDSVHTNIIMINMIRPGLTAQTFCDELEMISEGEERIVGERIAIKSLAFYRGVARLVVYSDITASDVELAIKKINFVMEKFASCT